MAYCPSLIQGMYKWQNVIPNPLMDSNKQIVVSGAPLKQSFSVLASNTITDLHALEQCQVFPLKWNIQQNSEISLFECENKEDSLLAITDDYLEYVRRITKITDLTKEDIFYYIYALLHSKEYRDKYISNLSKSVLVLFIQSLFLSGTIRSQLI